MTQPDLHISKRSACKDGCGPYRTGTGYFSGMLVCTRCGRVVNPPPKKGLAIQGRIGSI